MAALDQSREDRVIRAQFDKLPSREPDEENPTGTFFLLAELTGRHGNIFLLDSKQFILASLLPNHSYRRKLVPGEKYQYPDPPSNEIEKILRQDCLGMAESPADGTRSMNVHLHYIQRLKNETSVSFARESLRRLRKENRSLNRRLQAISKDLDRGLEAQKYRNWGELLQSAYGTSQRGAESIEVPDYYSEGMPPVTIPLEKKLDLKENIKRYFQLYKKHHGALQQIQERLESTRDRHEKILHALEKAEGLAWIATGGKVGQSQESQDPEMDDQATSCTTDEGRSKLEEFMEQLEIQKLLRQRQKAAVSGQKAPTKRALPYREFKSITGKTILVGKGGKHNDSLTLRIARGGDLWLHAHDWAGAHVIVRLERKEEVDHESLLDAATLAAHYSKGKNATKIEVQYTQTKHISKPRGFPPGQVSVANSRVILIKIEEDRLKRLFDEA